MLAAVDVNTTATKMLIAMLTWSSCCHQSLPSYALLFHGQETELVRRGDDVESELRGLVPAAVAAEGLST